MNIMQALENLDPDNDAHWTANGIPRLDVLRVLTANDTLTRQEVTDANPEFIRYPAAATELTPKPIEEDDSVKTPSDSEQATETSPEVMVEAVEPTAEAVEPTPVEPVAAATPTPQTKLEALQASLAVHTEAMNDADRVKSEADKSLKASSDQVNALSAEIAAIVKNDPHAATAGIRDYIAQSNKTRMARAMAAQNFMGDSKVKIAEVVKAVEVHSPLDKAMRGRKTPRGSQRPPIRG